MRMQQAIMGTTSTTVTESQRRNRQQTTQAKKAVLMRPPRRERKPVKIWVRVAPVDRQPTTRRMRASEPITLEITMTKVCATRTDSISNSILKEEASIWNVMESARQRQPQNTPVPHTVMIVAIMLAKGQRPMHETELLCRFFLFRSRKSPLPFIVLCWSQRALLWSANRTESSIFSKQPNMKLIRIGMIARGMDF